MRKNIYNYTLYKNKMKIGEQNITIKERDVGEQITMELYTLGGKKDVIYFDVISGVLEYYYKKNYEVGFLKYHEALELVENGRYLINKPDFENKVIFNEQISIYEKELFVPMSEIDGSIYKKLIISLESMKTYRIRFILMNDGAYKLFVPEKVVAKYDKDNVCVQYKNIENGIEMINEY